MKTLGRVLLFLVLLLVLVVFTGLYTVIFTEQGARRVASTVSQLLPLEMDVASGSLGGRLHLSHLSYQIDSLQLSLDNVVVEIAPDCLWRATICFDRLQVGHLELKLIASAADDDTPVALEEVAPLIEFPLPLEVPALEIESLRVQWSGGEWSQGALRAAISVNQSAIDVFSAQITAPRLLLVNVEGEEAPSPGTTLLPAIDLPLHLSVDALELIAPTWDLYGALHQQDSIVLDVQWLHHDLDLRDIAVTSKEFGTLSMRGNLSFSDLWPLDAEGTIALSDQLQELPDWLGKRVEFTAQGDLASLAVHVNSDGAVDVAAQAQVNVLDSTIPFSSTLTATSDSPLAISELYNESEALQDSAIQFPLMLSVDGSLEAQNFVLEGGFTGLGYESIGISLAGLLKQSQLEISALSVRDKTTDDSLQLQGEVLLAAPYKWTLALQTTGWDVPAINEAVQGRLDGSLQLVGVVGDEEWQVSVPDVALQGRVNDMPARISGFAGFDSEMAVSASALQAQLNGARLTLQSPGDDVGPALLHLEIDDIGQWLAQSSGAVVLDAEVSAGRDAIHVSGSVVKLQSSSVNVERVTLRGNYHPDADHAFDLKATLSEVVADDRSLDEVLVSASGDWKKHSLTVASRGAIDGELNVTGSAQDKQWRGVLAPTRLQTPIGEWVLSQAVAMRGLWEPAQLTVEGHCWQHAQAELCPASWVLAADGGGEVQLNAELALLAEVLPPEVDVAGQLQLQLAVQWAPDTALALNGNVRTGAVAITQRFEDEGSATFGWEAADAELNSTSRGLQISAGVERNAHQVVELELLLPADRNAALSGSLQVNQMQLATLSPFVPTLSTLKGEINGTVSLSGTLDRPQGAGKMVLTKGHVALEGNPTQLEALELRVDVDGASATFHGEGLLGGGELTLVGQLRTAPELQLELTVDGTNHEVLYPPSAELRIAEKLQVTVTKNLLELTGKIDVLDGVLEFEELPEGSVALSPSIVEINADGSAVQQGLPLDVRMNVQVHIAKRFTLTGSTVHTQLGGDLRVQQRVGQPLQLFGNLNTDGGEFRAYQTRLEIKRGTINFTGPPTNPTVNVRAERHISSSDVTVGVSVTGPVEEELQLEIYSDPSMTQANAMSYLVRGRGMDAGVGLDGASAALSLASGVVNRSELVAELNQIPGISNIEFGAQGSETDATATVSGYLGERIFLSYGVGLYEPVNVLTARFYIRSRLWLEVVSSLENSLDIYYSFDID